MPYTDLERQYGICTAGQRTWGGPRADAGKADEKTTAEQVVADAEATGDDLNVDPETFRPAAEARTNRYIHAPLQPPSHLQGRFAPSEQLPGGWYHQANDSEVLRPDLSQRPPGEQETAIASQRTSWQSLGLGTASSRSTLVPRRVESFVGIEAVTAYHNQQAAQRPAGGAYFEAPRSLPPAPVRAQPTSAQDTESRHASGNDPPVVGRSRSVSSSSSVSMHFAIPSRERNSTPPPPQPRSYTPTQPHDNDPPHLLMPPRTYHPGSSAKRTGRSPLARKSFTRLATTSPEGDVVELEVETRVPRGASRERDGDGDEGEWRGRRRRRSFSVDAQGRRRLSKQQKDSRDQG